MNCLYNNVMGLLFIKDLELDTRGGEGTLNVPLKFLIYLMFRYKNIEYLS